MEGGARKSKKSYGRRGGEGSTIVAAAVTKMLDMIEIG